MSTSSTPSGDNFLQLDNDGRPDTSCASAASTDSSTLSSSTSAGSNDQFEYPVSESFAQDATINPWLLPEYTDPAASYVESLDNLDFEALQEYISNTFPASAGTEYVAGPSPALPQAHEAEDYFAGMSANAGIQYPMGSSAALPIDDAGDYFSAPYSTPAGYLTGPSPALLHVDQVLDYLAGMISANPGVEHVLGSSAAPPIDDAGDDSSVPSSAPAGYITGPSPALSHVDEVVGYFAGMSSANPGDEHVTGSSPALPLADKAELFVDQPQAPLIPAPYNLFPAGGVYSYPPSAPPHVLGMAFENVHAPQIATEHVHQPATQELEKISASTEAEYPAAHRMATAHAKPLSTTGRPNEAARPEKGAAASEQSTVMNKGKKRARDIQENLEYFPDATANTAAFRVQTDYHPQYYHQAFHPAAQSGGQDDGNGTQASASTHYRFENTTPGEEPARKRNRTNEAGSSSVTDAPKLVTDGPKRTKRTYTKIRPDVFSCSLCDELLTGTSKNKHAAQCGRTVAVCNICGFTTTNCRRDSMATHQKSAKCRAVAAMQAAAALLNSGGQDGASSTSASATEARNGGHGYGPNDRDIEASNKYDSENTEENKENTGARPLSIPIEHTKEKKVTYRFKVQKL
ncbi:hypothetical protein EYR36_003343 [Pleurotus pulmonarius]|nr:hypothetical protein EYR36_003343 [Pleurotus pulmonarius]KAF4582312.1 hypothetical protein EYR38_002430 [Pleurotus pulmonarius]